MTTLGNIDGAQGAAPQPLRQESVMVAIVNPINAEVITAAERARANVQLGCGAAFDAITKAAEVTAARRHPLAKAREYLGRARNHWARAKAQGASPQQLAALEGFGRRAAQAVAEAEARAAEGAAKAERVRRAMLLKGMNALEAARVAADSMVSAGLVADRVAGMSALVEITGHLALATTDAVLAAWLQVQP